MSDEIVSSGVSSASGDTGTQSTPTTSPASEQNAHPQTGAHDASSRGEASPQTETGAESSDASDAEKRESGWQREKRKAEAARAEAARERARADALLELLQRNGNRPEPATETHSSSNDGPPDPSRYPLGEVDAKYAADLAVHAVKQERMRERQEAERAEQWREFSKKRDGFKERSEKVAEHYEGFHETIDRVLSDPNVPISTPVAQGLIEDERGPEIAYHLAKNPSVLERLNSLSPMRAAIEIGRLSAMLPQAPARQQTSAPPPPTQLRPKGATPKVYDPYADTSEDASKFIEWNNSRKRA